MTGKISANGTYVFAAEDLDELDELSFTSILSAVPDPAAQPAALKSAPTATEEPTGSGDTTINEMLSAPDSEIERLATPSGASDAALEEAPGDLIDATLLFPELSDGKKSRSRG